ncbi:MAG: hypothetical protein ACTSPY_12995 [Candidatus Helarchaeota archaeon]
MVKFKTIDDLLNSDYLILEKLKKLLIIAELDLKNLNTKEKMVNALLYETVFGLDEILNILFTEFELKEIWKQINPESDISNYKKSNIIGILIRILPTKRERKIETVIEEAIDEDMIFQPIIYYLFLMTPDGRAVFTFNFRPIEIGDLTMFTSALNGISILLEELTNRNRLENIELGMKDKKDSELELMFEYGDLELDYPSSRNIIGILIVNHETENIREALKKFILEFEKKYGSHFIPYWNGRISDFYPAKHLVYQIFSDYIQF